MKRRPAPARSARAAALGRGAGDRAAGRRRRSRCLHAVHAAERAARDPARGSQRAARHRQRLVPRRLGAREAGPHRLRAPVRAPDVRGLGTRASRASSTRCSRPPAATTTARPTNDRTNYYIDVPSNALELALFLESDRMGYLLDTMTPKTVDGQRDVVKNERRQSYENRPYGMADDRARRDALSRRAIRTTGRSSATWRT